MHYRSIVQLGLFLFLIIPGSPFRALGEGNATRVNEVLLRLKEKPSPGERLELMEEDLNAWAALVVQAQGQKSLTSLSFEFLDENRVRATTEVDLDEVPAGDIPFDLFPGLLTGRHTVVAEGTIEVSERQATFTMEAASVDALSVPSWVANQLLSHLSRSRPPNVDVTEPFPLPFEIRDIQVQQDRAVILR